MKRVAAGAFAVTIVLASATACDRTSPGSARRPVLVGYRDAAGALPLLLASATKEPAGLDWVVSATRYPSEADLGKALSRGDTSIGVMPLLTAADLILSGEPVVIVGVTAESYGRDGIVGANGVDSLDELSGRRAAVTSRSGAFFLWSMLSRAGLDPLSVTVERKSYKQIRSALAGEDYAAGVLTEPGLREASDVDGREVMMTTEDFPGVLVDVLVVHKGFARDEPETVARVAAVLSKAGSALAAEPASALEPIAKEATLTPGKVRVLMRGLRFPDRSKAAELMGVVGAPGALADSLEEALSFLGQSRGVEVPADVAGLIDSRFVNPAKR